MKVQNKDDQPQIFERKAKEKKKKVYIYAICESMYEETFKSHTEKNIGAENKIRDTIILIILYNYIIVCYSII